MYPSLVVAALVVGCRHAGLTRVNSGSGARKVRQGQFKVRGEPELSTDEPPLGVPTSIHIRTLGYY